jgi:lysine 2,3-aminomutase
MTDYSAAMQTQKGIKAGDWADWRWHMRNRIRSLEELKKWIDVSVEEAAAISAIKHRYLWWITPYYASLMNPTDAQCPIRLQALPSVAEMRADHAASVDPVGDRKFRVTNRIIHKYPDRAILLVTSLCPVLCRFCTRKHHTTALNSTYFQETEGSSMDQDFDYLRKTVSVRDVLLTGGDPLSYSDDKLERIIAELRSIPHIEIIRIGSRFPALLPQRITPSLAAMLEKYHPIWINTHFNHPRELTPEALHACDVLLRHGIPVGNQTVLLRGVNDDLATMRALCHRLVQARVRPYYIYHCDNVEGVSHFQTTISTGQSIMRGLIGYTTGFAVPQYVITTEAGKIPLSEEYLLGFEDDGRLARLRAYTGDIVVVPTRPDPSAEGVDWQSNRTHQAACT